MNSGTLLNTLMKVSRMHRICRPFGETNLTENEFKVLSAISQADEVNSYSVIKEKIKLHDSQISVLLSGLDKKGYIERRRNPADRRSVDIKLTENGQNVLAEAVENYIKLDSYLIKELGEEKTEEYIKISKELMRLYKGYNS